MGIALQGLSDLLALQPRVNNQTACQRSRSRGVGARYIRSRTTLPSNCQRFNVALISSIFALRREFLALAVYHTRSAGFTLGSV